MKLGRKCVRESERLRHASIKEPLEQMKLLKDLAATGKTVLNMQTPLNLDECIKM